MPQEPTDSLLSIGEAARSISVSVDTLRRWSKDGRIPVVVLPSGHRRFRASDLERIKQASA